MNKLVKYIWWIKISKWSVIAVLLSFLIWRGELILRYSNESYQDLKKAQIWKSRIKSFRKTNTTELKGHWHLIKDIPKQKSIFTGVPTIDFENDNMAILGKFQGEYGGIGGYHDSVNQSIRFGGECFLANFRYEIKGDKLKVTYEESGNIEESFTAIRCEDNCCNKQEEFFYGQPDIKIDLPVIVGVECMQVKDLSLETRLYLGLLKRKSNKKSHIEEYKLVLGYKISKITDIELWEKRTRIKVLESKRENIYKVMYADRNTPTSVLIPYLQYLKNKGDKSLYFALREEDIRDKIKICYKEVGLEKLNELENVDKTLENWLNED